MALATQRLGRQLLTVVCVLGILLLPSCLFVKAPTQKPPVPEHADLSPLPEIKMGEELVRTAEGDMIAQLPESWVLLDPGTNTSNDVLVVAVNPEYTVSAVFSTITVTSATTGAVDSDGLLGLARTAYNNHQRRSGGNASLAYSYAIDTLGTRMFGTYSFTTPKSNATRCAVFTSTLGNHYEFALVPLSISGRSAPADRMLDKMFLSILATVQY